MDDHVNLFLSCLPLHLKSSPELHVSIHSLSYAFQRLMQPFDSCATFRTNLGKSFPDSLDDCAPTWGWSAGFVSVHYQQLLPVQSQGHKLRPWQNAQAAWKLMKGRVCSSSV